MDELRCGCVRSKGRKVGFKVQNRFLLPHPQYEGLLPVPHPALDHPPAVCPSLLVRLCPAPRLGMLEGFCNSLPRCCCPALNLCAFALALLPLRTGGAPSAGGQGAPLRQGPALALPRWGMQDEDQGPARAWPGQRRCQLLLGLEGVSCRPGCSRRTGSASPLPLLKTSAGQEPSTSVSRSSPLCLSTGPWDRD